MKPCLAKSCAALSRISRALRVEMGLIPDRASPLCANVT